MAKAQTKQGKVLECLSGPEGVKRVGNVYPFSDEKAKQPDGSKSSEFERLVEAGIIAPA